MALRGVGGRRLVAREDEVLRCRSHVEHAIMVGAERRRPAGRQSTHRTGRRGCQSQASRQSGPIPLRRRERARPRTVRGHPTEEQRTHDPRHAACRCGRRRRRTATQPSTSHSTAGDAWCDRLADISPARSRRRALEHNTRSGPTEVTSASAASSPEGAVDARIADAASGSVVTIPAFASNLARQVETAISASSSRFAHSRILVNVPRAAAQRIWRRCSPRPSSCRRCENRQAAPRPQPPTVSQGVRVEIERATVGVADVRASNPFCMPSIRPEISLPAGEVRERVLQEAGRPLPAFCRRRRRQGRRATGASPGPAARGRVPFVGRLSSTVRPENVDGEHGPPAPASA